MNKYDDYIQVMFQDICNDFNLDTGDMPPEDVMALKTIIKNFIDNNK